MAFCMKCGAEVGEGIKFCAKCGAPIATEADTAQQTAQEPNKDATEAINEAVEKTKKVLSDLNQTKDTTAEHSAQDIEENKLWAILSYIAFLCFLPLAVAKESKFAMYHANQGCVLFILEIVLGIITAILSLIPVVGGIISAIFWLVILALVIVGILNAVNGKAKELPVIGGIIIIK